MNTRTRKPSNLDDKHYAKVKAFGSRLKQSRIDAGMTQAELARAMDLTRSSIAQWEGGLSTPSLESFVELGKKLSVRPEFLSFGVTDEPVEVVPSPTKLGYSILSEVTFTGPNKYDETGSWALPLSLLMTKFSGPEGLENSNIVMVKVQGDGMAPRYEDGDIVLVDLNDTKLSPAGVFLHWDGIGPLFSKMSVVPSAPTGKKASPTIQVSDEKGQLVYTSTSKDLSVMGRVKGVWKS